MSSQWTVEQFAELCAYLEAQSAVRERLLAQVGLDESSWATVRAEWLGRLTDRDTPELVWVFGRAYARALTVCLQSAPTPELPEQRDEAPEPEPTLHVEFHEDHDEETVIVAPEPAEEDDPNRTSHGAFPLAGSALPFRSTGFATVPGRVETPRQEPPSTSDAEPSDPTVVLGPVSVPERVLPFLSPSKTNESK